MERLLREESKERSITGGKERGARDFRERDRWERERRRERKRGEAKARSASPPLEECSESWRSRERLVRRRTRAGSSERRAKEVGMRRSWMVRAEAVLSTWMR